MDEIGDSLQGTLRQVDVELFKKYGIEPSALENGYVPVDIDVNPFIDEKCSKEGISKTYKRNIRRELPGDWLGGLCGACTETDARL